MNTAQRLWEVKPPIGNLMVPKPQMNEKDLREYALQINQNEDQVDVWKEKVEKDPIDTVIEWLRMSGYTVTEVK
jgi:hypothetical protein